MTSNSDPANTDAGSGAGGRIRLRRSLGLVHVVLYGLGVTIGAGIYVLIAAVAARAGHHAPLAFVIAALSIGLTGASFAELGSRMPLAAGPVVYAHAAFRSEIMARLIGLLVVAMTIVSAAAISAGAAGYVGVFVAWPRSLVVALVVLAMGAVAGRGIRESIAFAGIMTLIEVGGLLLIVALGIAHDPAAVAEAGRILPRTLDTEVWSGIVAASLLAVFAFIGFEGIVNIAEEMADPRRTLPRAILLTLVLTTLLYVAVTWVALAAVGPTELAAAQAPLALVFEHVAGVSPRTMAAIAIVAILNGVIVNIIMAARVIYGLAERGGLPIVLAQLHPRLATPVNATALATFFVLALALGLPLGALADWSARATLALFALLNTGLFLIKSREAQPPSGIYVAPGWVPVAGAASCVAFLGADIALLLR